MFLSLIVQYQFHARGMFVNNRKARDHLTVPRIMAVERPRLRDTYFSPSFLYRFFSPVSRRGIPVRDIRGLINRHGNNRSFPTE